MACADCGFVLPSKRKCRGIAKITTREAPPVEHPAPRPMKLRARTSGRSGIGYWLHICQNGDEILEMEGDNCEVLEEIAYRINSFEAPEAQAGEAP